jgi:hypothetical protein
VFVDQRKDGGSKTHEDGTSMHTLYPVTNILQVDDNELEF